MYQSCRERTGYVACMLTNRGNHCTRQYEDLTSWPERIIQWDWGRGVTCIAWWGEGCISVTLELQGTWDTCQTAQKWTGMCCLLLQRTHCPAGDNTGGADRMTLNTRRNLMTHGDSRSLCLMGIVIWTSMRNQKSPWMMLIPRRWKTPFVLWLHNGILAIRGVSFWLHCLLCPKVVMLAPEPNAHLPSLPCTIGYCAGLVIVIFLGAKKPSRTNSNLSSFPDGMCQLHPSALPFKPDPLIGLWNWSFPSHLCFYLCGTPRRGKESCTEAFWDGIGQAARFCEPTFSSQWDLPRSIQGSN